MSFENWNLIVVSSANYFELVGVRITRIGIEFQIYN